MIYILLIINLFTFVVFGLDKRLAVKHKRRVPEITLLGLTLTGGSVGAALGMLIFRHKVSKVSFLLKWVAIILIQAAGIYFFEKYR
ncbi:membrane protein [Chryseobacterium angstadtii]|uniref:Membrane protein n=2 Tax=Chryseobacterium angstadtii TaxID=558151 RepID=A0A0J7IGV8_9FLAO|nr:membrane protein [Chryseobacterium angstadtii]